MGKHSACNVFHLIKKMATLNRNFVILTILLTKLFKSHFHMITRLGVIFAAGHDIVSFSFISLTGIVKYQAAAELSQSAKLLAIPLGHLNVFSSMTTWSSLLYLHFGRS